MSFSILVAWGLNVGCAGSQQAVHAHPTITPPVSASLEKAKTARLPFTLHVSGVESPFAKMSAFVMPSQVLDFSVTGASDKLEVSSKTGSLSKAVAGAGARAWKWTAPAEWGRHEITLRDSAKNATMMLQVFVLRPYDGSGQLAGKKIGKYVVGAKDGNPAYKEPRGFVEVDETLANTEVSPNFKLSQFFCKNSSHWPRHVALQTALLVKLELVIETLAEAGIKDPKLYVMSGFRTPAYNRGIGNETSLSRHLYGDAADVFVDRDGDHKHDDVDGDGVVTRADAKYVQKILEEKLEAKLPPSLSGGMAHYGSNHAHGPFVHIDTRGHKARW